MNKIGYVDETWNPIVGCEEKSEGCLNCWAYRMAQRQAGQYAKHPENETYKAYFDVKQWNGETRLIESALTKPLWWKKPCRIAVVFMGDLFCADFADIDKVMLYVLNADWHKYIFCTKRPSSLIEYLKQYIIQETPEGQEVYFKNTIFLVSVENQARANERIPELIKLKSIDSRFKIGVSCEPLLDAIDLTPYLKDLDWVIAGGETGAGARFCDYDWIKKLWIDCKKANVPFWFKHWGDNNSQQSDDSDVEIAICKQYERGYDA